LLVVGDAAGFVINTGFMVRGMDLAISSGVAAAKAVLRARETGDYSTSGLKIYEEFLRQTRVFHDLTFYREAPGFSENPRLYTTYPELAVDLLTDLFTVKGRPPRRIKDLVRDHLRRRVSLWQLVRDAWKGARSI